VRKGAAIVAICIEGKQISSDELAQFLAQRACSGAGDVAFVIGSSHGLSDEVKKAAALKFSMGRITMPHQLARLVLTEQIYRACAIHAGLKYHQLKVLFWLPERLRTLRELFLQNSVETAGQVIFGFPFGTDFILLITWSDLLLNTAANFGWQNP